MVILIGLFLKITKLRSFPVLPSYPKQGIELPKTVIMFYCVFPLDVEVIFSVVFQMASTFTVNFNMNDFIRMEVFQNRKKMDLTIPESVHAHP